MSTDDRDYELELQRIVDGVVESILEAPEDELDGDLRAAGEDPGEAAERTRGVLLAAVRRHRRLRPARAEHESQVSAMEKREYRLPETAEEQRKLLAFVFDQRPEVAGMLTLQFRDLRSLPDEDVESCLRHLAELGVLDDLPAIREPDEID